MSDLHKKIVAIRKLRNLNQEHVAEKSFIHPRTYQRIEAGQSPVTLNQLEHLAEALGCTVREIRSFNLENNRFEGAEQHRKAEELARENALLAAEVHYLRQLLNKTIDLLPDFLKSRKEV